MSDNLTGRGERLTPSEAFARRMREARERAGMKQTELADKLSDLGYELSRPAINAIENGKRGVSLDDACAIAAALAVAPVNLIVPFEDPEPIDEKTALKGIFRPTALLTVGALEMAPAVGRAWIRGVEIFPEATLEERFRFHVEEVAPPARYRLEQVAEGKQKKWWMLAEERQSRFGMFLRVDRKADQLIEGRGLSIKENWLVAEHSKRKRPTRKVGEEEQ
jgi:transcriptional regulator with XRE-family HTH domain